MTASKNVTPAKFRCGETTPTCPSVHETENGDIIFADGESAVRCPREFMDAFFMEYAAKLIDKERNNC